MTFAVRSLRASSPTSRSTASARDSTLRTLPAPLQRGQTDCVDSSSDGRRRWRDSSSRPKREILPIWIRARSWLHGIAQPVLDLALVALRPHVDEVDDDEAAEVANSELPADLVGRFEVRVERRFLDVLALRRARRVDVDRGQRFRSVDHDAAARWQRHLMVERRLDLALDLVTREQRYACRRTA